MIIVLLYANRRLANWKNAEDVCNREQGHLMSIKDLRVDYTRISDHYRESIFQNGKTEYGDITFLGLRKQVRTSVNYIQR